MIDPTNAWAKSTTIKIMNGKKSCFQYLIYIDAESPLSTVINVFQPLRLKLDDTQIIPPFSKLPFPISLPMTKSLPLKKLYISSLMD